MHYKTIVLELLKQHPEIHKQLCINRMLLPTLEFYSRELKNSHEACKTWLSQATPGRNESQIASEALEIALRDLEHSLHSEFPSKDREQLSVEEAMAFIRGHTPRE